jgi:hypothetical protein
MTWSLSLRILIFKILELDEVVFSSGKWVAVVVSRFVLGEVDLL